MIGDNRLHGLFEVHGLFYGEEDRDRLSCFPTGFPGPVKAPCFFNRVFGPYFCEKEVRRMESDPSGRSHLAKAEWRLFDAFCRKIQEYAKYEYQ